MLDLSEDVDRERDHIRGPDSAPVTLVEYGDYECPYCGQAEVVIRELLGEFGDELRYVWRHLPLNDVHLNAQMAAEAAEAAAAQGAFWPMHDMLLVSQEDLHARGVLRGFDEASASSRRSSSPKLAKAVEIPIASATSPSLIGPSFGSSTRRMHAENNGKPGIHEPAHKDLDVGPAGAVQPLNEPVESGVALCRSGHDRVTTNATSST